MNNVLVHYFKKISCFIEQDLRSNTPDLTGGQCFIISYIHKNGDRINQSQLEKIFGQRRSSISSLISNLEKLGFIERLNSSEDKRKKEIILTPKGLERSKEIRNNLMNCENKLSSGLDESDKEKLIFLFDKMIENMKEEAVE